MPVIPSTPPSTVGLISIGPVSINHGDPQFSWDANPTGHGILTGTLGGSCLWFQAQTLRELVNNPDNRTTVASYTGVLEWVIFGGDLLADLTGYYLLLGFNYSPSQQHSLAGIEGDVPFTVSFAYLGDLA